MRRWGSRMVAVTAMPLLVGCFTYADIERGAVVPGMTVRAVVDREEAVRQMDVLGALRERVDGEVLEQTDASTLAMTVRSSATPADGGRFNSFVAFRWSTVSGLQVKRFSPLRTAALVGGAGVATALTLAVIEGGSKPGSGEGPPTNNAVRLPLLRFRW